MSTIFALSSGNPPAAIGVIRISGPQAVSAAQTLVEHLPAPRRAGLRRLRDPETQLTLDHALVLVFPGPKTATGEDLVEFHCHGGRAVVSAVKNALSGMDGLREAAPGEFTRRALESGRIDLAEAEGLGDLLSAETESQRRAALQGSEGRISAQVERWCQACVSLSAAVEAVLDHDDEGDVSRETNLLEQIRAGASDLAQKLASALINPPVERLRDGLMVVLAGPPNVGKSTLMNALVERDAAIVSPIAGTTRDRIEMAVQRSGIAYRFVDTAGLAEQTDDPIEAIGIERSRASIEAADLLLWLGDREPAVEPGMPWIWLHPRSDMQGRCHVAERLSVSAVTGEGMRDLWAWIEDASVEMLPRLDQLALNQRQRELVAEAEIALRRAADEQDLLLVGEQLRIARKAFDRITGRADTEAMLDALFSRFCIGK